MRLVKILTFLVKWLMGYPGWKEITNGHYVQVQGQLALIGVPCCNFIVYISGLHTLCGKNFPWSWLLEQHVAAFTIFVLFERCYFLLKNRSQWTINQVWQFEELALYLYFISTVKQLLNNLMLLNNNIALFSLFQFSLFKTVNNVWFLHKRFQVVLPVAGSRNTEDLVKISQS